MSFRAIAVDYDGTITLDSRPSEDLLLALREARGAGVKILLVTGRILAELSSVFPEAFSTFDAIVAENGAILWSEAAGSRPIAPPVPPALVDALRARDVFVRRGDVLLATEAHHDIVALQAIARLGLDCQLVRNRGALMILPAGVSKGRGALEALGDLGISQHNTVAIGDAENDHSLLEACEIGVAVGNAVPALKAHADIVLAEPDGIGVARFVRQVVSGSLPTTTPSRWRIPIGTRADGTSVTLPGSGINVLIVGASGSGKSFLAGLIAERLLQLGYSACVFDPEGDHTHIGHLRGTVTLGGTEGAPPPTQLGRLLRRRYGGLVIDLSLMGDDERGAYTRSALEDLARCRAETGLPHWVFLDEAHVALSEGVDLSKVIGGGDKGFCFITYHPAELARIVLDGSDVVFFMPHSEDLAQSLLARTATNDPGYESVLAMVSGLHQGQAVLARVNGHVQGEIVTLGRRRSRHVRHQHKYVHGYLPPRHQFLFRDDDRATGRVAANLEDFFRELRLAPGAVLEHHARANDFSRWIAEALQDPVLAAAVRQIERSATDNEAMRKAMLEVVGRRYAEGEEKDGTGSTAPSPDAELSAPPSPAA
jgi:hydroxymethylpyrimidine pyrophosphatase-like HAD family hydrolase